MFLKINDDERINAAHIVCYYAIENKEKKARAEARAELEQYRKVQTFEEESQEIWVYTLHDKLILKNSLAVLDASMCLGMNTPIFVTLSGIRINVAHIISYSKFYVEEALLF